MITWSLTAREGGGVGVWRGSGGGGGQASDCSAHQRPISPLAKLYVQPQMTELFKTDRRRKI